MTKDTKISLAGWFLLATLIIIAFIFFKINKDMTDISRYEVTTCYNTENYTKCIYNVTKWQAIKAASAYGSGKDCVESRVELINGSYSVYFRSCNTFQR